MPFFQIVNGLTSSSDGIVKPGMVVEWTQEQADAWYPNQKGWIKPIEDPADRTVTRPTPAPTPEPKKERAYSPDPAETSAYAEPEPVIEPPEEPEKLYQKSQKKPRR